MIDNIDILDDKWITRSDREILSLIDVEEKKGFFTYFKRFIIPNIYFSFGKYKYGGLNGHPASIFTEADLNAKSSEVDRFLDTLKGSPDKLKLAKSTLKKFGQKAGMSTIRLLGWLLGKLWNMVFVSIEVEGLKETKLLFEHAKKHKKAVVFLPTHKSHVDYLLLSYICFGSNLPMPRIVAGDNLNMFLIGDFLARGGAFFIRRKNADDDLYKILLRKSIQDTLLSGQVLEVFLEGGRTRTGLISKPKLGVLNCICSVLEEDELKDRLNDVVLVPIAIDYENVLENIDAKGQSGYAALLLGAKKLPESFLGTVRLFFRLLFGGNSTHGKAFVKFGASLSLKEELDKIKSRTDDKLSPVKAIGNVLVQQQQHISKIAVISVVSLVVLSLTSKDYEKASAEYKLNSSFMNLSSMNSIQEMLNVLLCMKTNHFKRHFVRSVILPRFLLVSKILFQFHQELLSNTKKVKDADTRKGLCFDGPLLLLQETDFNIQVGEELLWGSLKVLESFFQKRLETSKLMFRKNHKHYYIEQDAKLRLNLRYTSAELNRIILPFSIAALSFMQLKTKQDKSLKEITEQSALLSYGDNLKVKETEVAVARKILLGVIKPSDRTNFDTLSRLFVSHVLSGLQSVELASTLRSSTVDETSFVEKEKLREKCFQTLIESTNRCYPWLPEILMKKLCERVCIFVQSDIIQQKSSSICKVLQEIRQRNDSNLSGYVLSRTLRDIDHVAKKRLRKILGFVMFLFIVRRWLR